MIGIGTSDYDYFQHGQFLKQLGTTDKTWILCSGGKNIYCNNINSISCFDYAGYMAHDNELVVQEQWRFFDKDKINIFYNGPDKTLSFGINGKHLGLY